jgi:hypothetical protein
VGGLPEKVFEAASLNGFLAYGPATRHTVHRQSDLELLLPFNMGRLLRPGAEPLPRKWRHVPMGYHGRSRTGHQ